MNIHCAKIRIILNNGHIEETVVNNFRYNDIFDTYTWEHHPSYPMFVQVGTGVVAAVVVLDIIEE